MAKTKTANLILASAGIVVAILIAGVCGLRFNVTPSDPYGIYWASAYRGGDLVVFCPEAGTWSHISARYRPIGSCADLHAPMLKHVLGKPGDVLTFSEQGFTLNGILLPNTRPRTRDHEGRHLPVHFYFTRKI